VPLYEYRCKQCGELREVRHGFKERHIDACLSCGGEMTRVFNPTGIVFKGSGFYVNDSRKSSGSEVKSESRDGAAAGEAAKTGDAAKAGDSAKSGDSKSDSSKSDSSKSDSKSESKSSDAKPSESAKPAETGGGSDKKASGKSDAAA